MNTFFEYDYDNIHDKTTLIQTIKLQMREEFKEVYSNNEQYHKDNHVKLITLIHQKDKTIASLVSMLETANNEIKLLKNN
jgi:predicted outer membrane protein